MDAFNVIIHLHKRHLPRSCQAVDAGTLATDSAHKTPNYMSKPTHLPVVDFDPALLYLKELEVCSIYRPVWILNFTL